MTPAGPRRQTREDGAVLVQVAVSLLVLTAFSAFVIDYGVFWLSRGQSQNAADAGALAGATFLAFDNYSDRVAATQVAQTVAGLNRVWLTPPTVDLVTYPGAADGCPVNGATDDPTMYGGEPSCVRVNVSQTLPTFFAVLLGKTSQSVRATAMARFVSANAVDCLRPIAIPDKWGEVTDGFPFALAAADPSIPVKFDKYSAHDVEIAGIQNKDSYSPPTPTVPGGFRSDDAAGVGGPGFRMTISEAPVAHNAPIRPGQFVAVDLDRVPDDVPNDEAAFAANLATCSGVPFGVRHNLEPMPGSRAAQFATAAGNLILKDTTAAWNPTKKTIVNSCAANATCTPPTGFSPRLIALPVFDVSEYDRTRWPGVTLNVQIVNVIGFFIEKVNLDNSVQGRVTYYPGLSSGGPGIAYQSTFLRSVRLTR